VVGACEGPAFSWFLEALATLSSVVLCSACSCRATRAAWCASTAGAPSLPSRLHHRTLAAELMLRATRSASRGRSLEPSMGVQLENALPLRLHEDAGACLNRSPLGKSQCHGLAWPPSPPPTHILSCLYDRSNPPVGIRQFCVCPAS
jgi:hypothetical protein